MSLGVNSEGVGARVSGEELRAGLLLGAGVLHVAQHQRELA